MYMFVPYNFPIHHTHDSHFLHYPYRYNNSHQQSYLILSRTRLDVVVLTPGQIELSTESTSVSLAKKRILRYRGSEQEVLVYIATPRPLWKNFFFLSGTSLAPQYSPQQELYNKTTPSQTSIMADTLLSSPGGPPDYTTTLLPVAISTLCVLSTVVCYWWTCQRGGVLLRKKRTTLRIAEIEEVSSDTKRLRLAFPRSNMTLGLPVGKHFKVYAPNPGKGQAEWNGR